MGITERFDYVIFGAGFGGTILAMVLRRLGHSVLLLERGSHPRFTIGESSTPFANLLLENLAAQYDLPFLRSLAQWGTWQKTFPQIACGLKRGFTFLHHEPGREIDFGDRNSQLLVAASPSDHVADTHWYRPDFDSFLVLEAQKLGVTYLDRVQVAISGHVPVWQLAVTRSGRLQQVHAGFAIDASGPHGVLPAYLQIASRTFDNFPRTHAAYAHFQDVKRLDQLGRFGDSPPPYPPDNAAVHHLFDDGWIWVLRFNNGIISAGAALNTQVQGAPEATWRELLNRFPTIGAQFSEAKAITPFYSASHLSFRRASVAGANWALLPATAGFVDPLLSTGFALNLLGVLRLAERLAHWPRQVGRFERETFLELDATAELISALYSKLNSFQEFAALSLLYFAGMSFTETAWRLGKKERAELFLLAADSSFAEIRRDFCARARAGQTINFSMVAEAIEPWDVAGLANSNRRGWYPVILQDLVQAREKLGASHFEIDQLLVQLQGNS